MTPFKAVTSIGNAHMRENLTVKTQHDTKGRNRMKKRDGSKRMGQGLWLAGLLWLGAAVGVARAETTEVQWGPFTLDTKHNHAPEIQILSVTQIGAGESKKLQVGFRYRDLDSPNLTLALLASADNGATWNNVPVVTVVGDTNLASKVDWQDSTLVWSVGLDWHNQFSIQMKIKLTLNDGFNPPPQGPTAKYLVIDVSPGPFAASYLVSELDVIPADLLSNPDYKTTKIVLRRFLEGSATFVMGSPVDEANRGTDELQHQVTLSRDYYAGLFEITQKQWELVTWETPSLYSGNTRPVERVSYEDIRGSSIGAGWPGNTAVDAGSFLGKLRARTGLAFDLPTEAQWEFACRSSSTGAYAGDLGLLAWYTANSDGVPHEVGTKAGNGWPLYDMHGNVLEWCLDWYADYPAGPVTDPVGATLGELRVFRGGNYNGSVGDCRSARRIGISAGSRSPDLGFRLALPGGL